MCIDLYNGLSNMTHGEVAGDNCKIIKSISGELIMVNVKNPENTVIIDPWKLTVKTIKNIIFDFIPRCIYTRDGSTYKICGLFVNSRDELISIDLYK